MLLFPSLPYSMCDKPQTVTSTTTNLQHLAHIFQIFASNLVAWAIARFGVHDWFIILIWMGREVAACFQHAFSSLQPLRPSMDLVFTPNIFILSSSR